MPLIPWAPEKHITSDYRIMFGENDFRYFNKWDSHSSTTRCRRPLTEMFHRGRMFASLGGQHMMGIFKVVERTEQGVARYSIRRALAKRLEKPNGACLTYVQVNSISS